MLPPKEKCILVADDFEDTAETLAELIRWSTPFDAIAVKDGQQALDHALAQRPHAAILDIDMPFLDGMQVAAAIRASYADCPPLIYAHTGGISAERAEASGLFDVVLRKPIDLDELFRLLIGTG